MLRWQNFVLLWLAGLISTVGDWVLTVGLPMYAYLLTRSVLVLSLSVLLTSIPPIVLGSIAGVFVDRWDRRAFHRGWRVHDLPRRQGSLAAVEVS